MARRKAGDRKVADKNISDAGGVENIRKSRQIIRVLLLMRQILAGLGVTLKKIADRKNTELRVLVNG